MSSKGFIAIVLFVSVCRSLICTPGDDCIIDCQGEDCKNTIINASLAASLTISCNNLARCYESSIICPSSNNCHITCNQSYGCQHTKVYAEEQGNIDLNCSGAFSCYFMTIQSPVLSSFTAKIDYSWMLDMYLDHVNAINIDCEYCQSSNIYADHAENINLTCFAYHSCDTMTINSTNADITNLTCIGSSACVEMTVNAINSTSVALYASGNYAWYAYNSVIYAWNAKSVNITCIGNSNDQTGCASGKYYVPATGLNLNCYGIGCYLIGYFYIWDYDGLKSIDYGLNTCDLCKGADCINRFYLFCALYRNGGGISYEYSDNYEGSECATNNCGCGYLQEEANMNTNSDKNDKMCPNYQEESTSKKSRDTIIIIAVVMSVILVLFVVAECVRRCFKIGDKQETDSLLGENQTQIKLTKFVNNKETEGM